LIGTKNYLKIGQKDKGKNGAVSGFGKTLWKVNQTECGVFFFLGLISNINSAQQ